MYVKKKIQKRDQSLSESSYEQSMQMLKCLKSWGQRLWQKSYMWQGLCWISVSYCYSLSVRNKKDNFCPITFQNPLVYRGLCYLGLFILCSLIYKILGAEFECCLVIGSYKCWLVNFLFTWGNSNRRILLSYTKVIPVVLDLLALQARWVVWGQIKPSMPRLGLGPGTEGLVLPPPAPAFQV